MARKRIDATTKKWIRCEADERAAANGCFFDEKAGQYTIDWIARYLRLYEGEWAGQPFVMINWQVEATMRMFGWRKWSDRWNRNIRRYRKASIFIPKKNAKSPSLAAWGLYLLCGDGEQGGKVFFGAKDGSQAREIAGKHAIEMVTASEELIAECSINKTKMEILHEASRSTLRPISSGDQRSQKGKEGLNGSVLIDETHVVDRSFMDRMSRAGISRSEPLQIEVSTAGNDPEGYGKSQYDYGKLVESGGIDDESFFFLSYEAPQDVSDEEIQANPVKFGKMANPMWGVTIGEEEFVGDCRSSSRSISEFANFKMYRLNVWQRAANPWLKPQDWSACRAEFDEEDMVGRNCWAGLDLSKTNDMTALVLIFEEAGEYWQLPYFFMPEETAKEKQHLVPFTDWAAEGWIILTEGNTVDYRVVEEKIVELHGKFGIKEIVYDPMYADDLTQRVAEGLGIERLKFPQTIMHFANPTAEYERAVIGGNLHHNGNPVLAWQAGHVRVKTDVNMNRRPVKPEHGDIKKIDGIVAGIMGFSRACLGGGVSVYEERGPLIL